MKIFDKILWTIVFVVILVPVITNTIITNKVVKLQNERQTSLSKIKALQNEVDYYKANQGTTGVIVTDTVFYENPDIKHKYSKAISTIKDLEGKIVDLNGEQVSIVEDFEKRLKELMLSLKVSEFVKEGSVDVENGKYTVLARYRFPDDIMDMDVLKHYDETSILIPPIKKKIGLFLSVALNARKADKDLNYGVNVGVRKPDLISVNMEIMKQDSLHFLNFEIEAEHKWKFLHTFGRYYSLGLEEVDFLQIGTGVGWKALRLGIAAHDRNKEKKLEVFGGATFYKEYYFIDIPIELYTLGRIFWNKAFNYEFYVKAKSQIFIIEFKYNSFIEKNYWATRFGIELSL